MSSPCLCAGGTTARCIITAMKPSGGRRLPSIQPSPPAHCGSKHIRSLAKSVHGYMGHGYIGRGRLALPELWPADGSRANYERRLQSTQSVMHRSSKPIPGPENGQLLSSKYGILRAVRRFGWASEPRSFKVYPIALVVARPNNARVLTRPTLSADRLSGSQGIDPPSPFPARAVGGRPRQGRFGAPAELR